MPLINFERRAHGNSAAREGGHVVTSATDNFQLPWRPFLKLRAAFYFWLKVQIYYTDPVYSERRNPELEDPTSRSSKARRNRHWTQFLVSENWGLSKTRLT
uniref:Uncharacterized protein n=1 Tax=Physcomitrium patens TaxID=3218 RepID=A0A2K1KQA8_PHYPA|nr:hypothetical protein PHYPA_006879 [Physcomitrium patens]